MQKTLRKALSLTLSIIVVLSALAGALSVSATDVINTAPVNLDFSDGLNHWGPSDANTNATTDFDIVEENGVSYLQPKFGEGAPGVYKGVYSEKFKIPGVKAGDKIVALADYSVAQTGKLKVGINQYDSEGNKTDVVFIRTLTAASGYNGVCQNPLQVYNQGDNYGKTYIEVTDPNASYQLYFEDQTPTADSEAATSPTWRVSNAMIAIITSDDAQLVNEKYRTYTAFQNGSEGKDIYFDGAVAGGSAVDGYTIWEQYHVNRYPILSKPQNLNFSDGLKYWAPGYETKTLTKTSDRATVENGIVTFAPKTGNYAGLSSQRFRLNGITGDNAVKAGDTVIFYAQWRNHPDDAAKAVQGDVSMRAFCFTTDAVKKQGQPADWSGSVVKDNGYKDSKIPYDIGSTNDGWKYMQATQTVVNADDAYEIYIRYAGSGTKNAETGVFDDVARIQYKNIRAFKLLENHVYLDLATGEIVDKSLQPFGGTEEGGLKISYLDGYLYGRTEGALRNLTSYGYTNGFVNGDFSQGFKFWSGITANKDDPTTGTLTAQASVSNGVVTFNNFAASNGIISQGAKIPGLKVGDKLVLAFDANYSGRFQFNLKEYPSVMNGSGVAFASATAGGTDGGWSTSWQNWGTLRTTELTVTNPDGIFMVEIKKASTDKTPSIKNVRIYKVLEDGQLADVSMGVNETTKPVNADGGTAEFGATDVGTYKLPATNDIMNGNFSDGLKYWIPVSGNGSAADKGAYFTQGVDGVILPPMTNGTSGIMTMPITFDSKFAGKTAKFTFNLKAISGNPNYYIYSSINGVKTSTNATTMGARSTANFTIEEGKTYQFGFGASNPSGGTVALSNVKLLIVDDTQTVEMYTDISGNRYLGSVMKFQPLGGTEDNGIDSIREINNNTHGSGIASQSWFSRTYAAVPTLNGLTNGNFSEGLKYWSRVEYDAADLRDTLTVDKTTGIVAHKEGANDWGIISQQFRLPGIKQGDVLYAALDQRLTAEERGNAIQLNVFKNNGTTYVYEKNNGGGPTANPTANWNTNSSLGYTVDSTDLIFSMTVQYNVASLAIGGELTNARILRNDRGGLKVMKNGVLTEAIPKVNADGTLEETQLYGDANNDKEVNLLDIVRMKREAAYGEYNDFGIFLAAVDFDNDDVIGATDFTAVIGKVLDPTIVITK